MGSGCLTAEGYAYYWAGLFAVGLLIAGAWATVLVNRVVRAIVGRREAFRSCDEAMAWYERHGAEYER
jgi:hypothetical protein